MENEETTRIPKDTEDTQEQPKSQSKDPNKLTIEIHRFQNLLEILRYPKKVALLGFAITIIGTLLFCGITLIVLSIKRLYPYNDITTNAMGTTTLRSENKDVSYFLLNSSELWANSGIHVKKGQTITIKSSGKKHSAIHHLVKDAQRNNPKPGDPWVGSEGFPEDFDKRDPRDGERAKYRIFPKTNQDILLLQIVPNGELPIDRPNGTIYDSDNKCYKRAKNTSNKFIVVGNKMDNIHIDMDGVLYFAINDIVLDEETIIKMMVECDGQNVNTPSFNRTIIEKVNNAASLRVKHEALALQYKEYKKSINNVKLCMNTAPSDDERQRLNDSLTTLNDSITTLKKSLENHYDDFLNILNIKDIDRFKNKKAYGKFFFSNGYGIDSARIELYGYFMNNYKNAWYEDNVGSFLILVEKVND